MTTALDWHGPDDPRNPRNWSKGWKIYHTFVPSAVALVCTIASSIITSAFHDVQNTLDVSAEVSLLPYVLYLLGLGFGPLLAGPSSENFGRRPVYVIATAIFALFTLGAGFSTNIASLTICRFFAGFFGSPGLTIGGATLSDIWEPQERAIPWALYVTTPFLGPALGPLLGGYVTAGKDWRWTQWTILFLVSALLLSMLALKETYKPKILQNKLTGREKSPGEHPNTANQALRDFATKMLIRPVHMIFVEPVVGLFTLYIALNFGMLNAFFAAFQYVFAEAYGFGISSTGLTFLGLGAGAVIGCVIMISFSLVSSRRRAAQSKQLGRAVNPDPEQRLYLAMIGSVCLPVSLFWFGWSIHARVHWICPVVAEGVFACGNLLIFAAATLYVNQVYGPLYSASANAANAFARYIFSATFPLFIVQMYEGLGVGWASSLLGFVSVVMLPIPWIFHRVGPKLRAKSVYISSLSSM